MTSAARKAVATVRINSARVAVAVEWAVDITGINITSATIAAGAVAVAVAVEAVEAVEEEIVAVAVAAVAPRTLTWEVVAVDSRLRGRRVRS